MKKVQCPSCGGTGVIRSREFYDAYRCYKCRGVGFILRDNIKFSRKSSKACLIAFGKLQEFSGLVKVRNVFNVFIPVRGSVPYSVFYKEYRNLK